MKYIGLISDTHGFFDPKLEKYFSECDEIWHAGDIGNIETADTIRKLKPLRGVYGNIDGQIVRSDFPEIQQFKCEDMKVLMLHICGYPNKYLPQTRALINSVKPDLVIGGHSHILKVIYDKKNKHLHLNPGACGKSGLHKKRTALRFKILDNKVFDMDIIELENRYA